MGPDMYVCMYACTIVRTYNEDLESLACEDEKSLDSVRGEECATYVKVPTYQMCLIRLVVRSTVLRKANEGTVVRVTGAGQ